MPQVINAKKKLLDHLHEDVAAKEDGGLKRMLGEDENVAKRRSVTQDVAMHVCNLRRPISSSWLLAVKSGMQHALYARCIPATWWDWLVGASRCREELFARLKMLETAKAELMDANY